MRALKTACAAALLVSPAWAGDFSRDARGTTTASILKLGAGARGMSLGEAFSASASGPEALYWNPAALAPGALSAAFMHAELLETRYDTLAASGRPGGDWTGGIGLQYLRPPSIAETDSTGLALGERRPTDLAVSAALSRAFGGHRFGATLKFVRAEVVESASAWAADAGWLSPEWGERRLRLAFVVRNLGTKMKFYRASEPLPLVFRLAATARLGAFQASLEAGLPRDNRPFGAAGLERRWQAGDWALSARAGFNSRTLDDVGGLTSASFGLGAERGRFQVDYAAVPLGDLGLTHRVSLGVRLGRD